MGVLDLPLALALVAGAVAALNPCGFALLPAYLLMLVGDSGAEAPVTTRAQVLRAARFSAAMTVGFVAVFGVFGAVLARLSVSIERYLPVVTVVIGVALLAVGAVLLLRGGHLPGIGALARVGRAPNRTMRSQVLYGAGFATASLSCTIGPFLAVTGTASRTGSAAGALLTFVVYALGMGVVVTGLAMAVALAKGSAVARLRRAGPLLDRIGAGLLLVAGAYVTWYGWFEIRVLSGRSTGDPVVDAATRVQSSLAQLVAGLGPVVLTLLGVAVLVGVGALLLRKRQPEAKERTPT